MIDFFTQESITLNRLSTPVYFQDDMTWERDHRRPSFPTTESPHRTRARPYSLDWKDASKAPHCWDSDIAANLPASFSQSFNIRKIKMTTNSSNTILCSRYQNDLKRNLVRHIEQFWARDTNNNFGTMCFGTYYLIRIRFSLARFVYKGIFHKSSLSCGRHFTVKQFLCASRKSARQFDCNNYAKIH